MSTTPDANVSQRAAGRKNISDCNAIETDDKGKRVGKVMDKK